MLYVPAYSDLTLGSVVVFGDAGWVDLQLRDATSPPSTLALPVPHAQRDKLRVPVVTEPHAPRPAQRKGASARHPTSHPPTASPLPLRRSSWTPR